MRFVHPEAYLLGILVVLVLRRHFLQRGFVFSLRLIVLFLVLSVLAEPYIGGTDEGRDLVLIADRSRSVPEGSLDRVRETAELAIEARSEGDRIGLVTFGRNASLEQGQSEAFGWKQLQKAIDADGTDIAHAIERGLALIPPGRQGTLLLMTDGESTGSDPLPAAREAVRRGIRIDVAPFRRGEANDLAVEEIAAPDEVALGEPFQFSAWIRSDRALEAPVRLRRDGNVVSEGRFRFHKGLNRIVFRDRLAAQGLHSLSVEVDVDKDRVADNNLARAVVKVGGPFRVVCVTPQGREDRLTRSLRTSGIDVIVTSPQSAALGLDNLETVRAVVLENVAASDLPANALASIAHYVRDLGGGLLMTGGKASYGPGGYHKSAIADVLPVSLEIRQEQRKFALAMAIALDRSGSMSVPVPSGETKMDLANLGAVAAVELMSPMDAVSIIAVDSSAHVMVPMTAVDDPGDICDHIRAIESMGGGIFTSTAMHAAWDELSSAPQGTKHMVIFADANDAEEPGDYRTFVPDLAKKGVTVSVIGLGSDTDSDAAFLKDIARLGNGRVFFVSDPADLPRVFAQETTQVVRSSMVEEPTAVSVLPDILAVGELARSGFPNLGGYSIAYLKENASAGLVSKDEQKAPLLSFWQHGLGRSAAFLGEVDGNLSGDLGKWNDFAGFFSTVVRWIAGNEARQQVFSQLERRGHEGVLSIEVAEGKESLFADLKARVVKVEAGKPVVKEVLLERVAENKLEARFPLEREGVYRAVVQVGKDKYLRVPPVTLPYSPEFEPRSDPEEGEKLLMRIATMTGGFIDPPAHELFAGPRASLGVTMLGELCAWLALAFLLVEILVRRLHVHLPKLPFAKLLPGRRMIPATAGDAEVATPTSQAPTTTADPSEPAETEPELDDMLSRARSRARKRR